MKRMLFMEASQVPTRPNLKELRAAVSTAVEFEHAIIPLYLYALYSLDPKRNASVAELVESVVRDEMLHMMLACNLLNALGGSPNLIAPKFVPKYPGALPGTLVDGMKVSLARFSLRQVREVFMKIEQPDDPIDFEKPEYKKRAMHGRLATVGEFYRGILKQIEAGKGDQLFVGCPMRQVADPRMPELIKISDVDSARRAIMVIVEQGEGTSTRPTSDDGDYAHYYKFQQIANLRRLERNHYARARAPADQQHRFRRRLYYNWRGVWRVPANPKVSDYKKGSKARRACEIFNYTYTCLLRTLHSVVNGRPQELPASFGLMFSLKQQGLAMMSGKSTDGKPTGPTFERQWVMPK